MNNRLWISILSFTVALVACQGNPSLPPSESQVMEPVIPSTPLETEIMGPPTAAQPEDLSNAPHPEIAWNPSGEEPIIKATYCCGYTSESVAINYIPDAQIWGDGRIIWSQVKEDGSRTVLEGHLTPDELAAIVQRIVEAGFFGMKSQYADTTVTDMAEKCLLVSLTGMEKKVCEYAQGAPEAFHEMYQFLAEGAGAEGKPYYPQSGYLVATPLGKVGEVNLRQSPLVWDSVALGISLGQALDGVWIDGAALQTAWSAANASFYAPALQEGETLYQITLQIPGVSFQPPPTR